MIKYEMPSGDLENEVKVTKIIQDLETTPRDLAFKFEAIPSSSLDGRLRTRKLSGDLENEVKVTKIIQDLET